MSEEAQAFRDWFGVSPLAAKLAACLFLAAGGAVTERLLLQVVTASPVMLRHSMHRLRQAMDPGSIECAWGVGYRMTPAGMADCRAALNDFTVRSASGRRAA